MNSSTDRVDRLQLPEYAGVLGVPVGHAERELLTWPTTGSVMNLTHSDTRRFPPPPWIADEFLAAAKGGARAYTSFRGDADVRRSVAANVGHFLGIDIDPNTEIALTPGTQGALFAALAASVNPGDRVALVDPDYLSSERMVRFLGGEVDRVSLTWTDEGTPKLDTESLALSLSRGCRLFMLSHPNNPTGAVYPADVLDSIASLLEDRNACLLVDELYSRLIYDNAEFIHLISYPQLRQRCITTLGPSKTESMTGYRIGVVIAPPHMINAIEDVISITAIRPPAYSQWTLRRWLSDDKDFIHERVAEYQVLRDMTIDAFTNMDFLTLRKPLGTAYAFIDMSSLGLPDQKIATTLLNEANVIVNPGYQFGRNSLGGFRICFAQEEDRWSGALGRIRSALNLLRKMAD